MKTRMAGMGILVLVLVIYCQPALGESYPPWLDDYVDLSIVLRPSVNANPVIYASTGDQYSTLELKGDIYPLMGQEHAVIHKVFWEPETGGITLKVKTDLMGKGKFHFLPPVDMPDSLTYDRFRFMLGLITADSGVKSFVVNPISGIIHYRGSNHTDNIEKPLFYATEQEAIADGYTLCPACFAPIHNLPEYRKELALGQKVAAEIRSSNPVVMDDSLQAMVITKGQDVLNHWPQALRGYPYKFTVIESDSPNATACPGGWIFINNSLISLCESSSELEAVLAHEIAHVEMRHGLRELHHAEKSARTGTILAAIAGGIAASKGNSSDTNTFTTLAIMISSLATQLAISGYSREMEIEADAFAINYLANRYGPNQRLALSRILAKMEYFTGCQYIRKMGQNWDSFSSHPTTESRADFTRNANVKFFPDPMEFPLNDEGEQVALLQINGVEQSAFVVGQGRLDENSQLAEFSSGSDTRGHEVTETRIFATLNIGHRIKKASEFKDMKVVIDGQTIKFDNKEDTKLYPDTSISMVLVNKRNGRHLLSSLTPVEVQYDLRVRGKAKAGTGEF